MFLLLLDLSVKISFHILLTYWNYFSGNSLWTFFSASFSKNPRITHLLLSQNLLDKFLHHKMVYEHWSFLATIFDLVHWPNLVYKFHNYCTFSLWTLPKCFFVSKQNFFCKKLILLKWCIKLFRMTKSQRYFMENEFCFVDILFASRAMITWCKVVNADLFWLKWYVSHV